jgi:hypothetical protein
VETIVVTGEHYVAYNQANTQIEVMHGALTIIWAYQTRCAFMHYLCILNTLFLITNSKEGFFGPLAKGPSKYISRFKLVMKNKLVPRGVTIGKKVCSRRSILTRSMFKIFFQDKGLDQS